MKDFLEFALEEKWGFLALFTLLFLLFTVPPYIDSLFPTVTIINITIG
ncbi:hypothetical protein AH04_205 [Erwinia phage AH04]|uniref:Uncharacterized protein n=1 Tax=Erwinia phage AH04 TaxID=2869569 RepID=A0AAE8BR00_9CAUD|nr:hypothetical protein PQC02_gp109 [Erwinia phage AH04]QZA70680.1 hypothetical protein AH04_205 [Erwinia phage AH04]